MDKVVKWYGDGERPQFVFGGATAGSGNGSGSGSGVGLTRPQVESIVNQVVGGMGNLTTDTEMQQFVTQKLAELNVGISESQAQTLFERFLAAKTELATDEEVAALVAREIAKVNTGGSGGKGEKGDDGLSAYQIAVNNGFVGNVSQWLDSLRGQDGQRGERGLRGEKGERGEQGLPGRNGQQGERGLNGASAYELAVAGGYQGSQSEWLLSLKGEKGESGGTGGGDSYREYVEGYYTRADLERFNGGTMANFKFVTCPWPKPFSDLPNVQITLNIVSASARIPYIQNVTKTGFDVACNYAAELHGVWFRAYLK